MKFKNLDIVRSLANKLQNTIKGAAYVDKEGKSVSLLNKDEVTHSKKELRGACNVFMPEKVARCW